MRTITTHNNTPSSLDICDEEKLKAYQERRSLTSKYNTVSVAHLQASLSQTGSNSSTSWGFINLEPHLKLFLTIQDRLNNTLHTTLFRMHNMYIFLRSLLAIKLVAFGFMVGAITDLLI